MGALNAVLYDDAVSVTTTDAFVTALSLDTRQLKQLALTIRNTGAAVAKVQILTYTKHGSIAYQELAPTTLSPNSSLRYLANKFLAQIIVQVMSSVAGLPTTVAVEYTSSKV